jgi:hypothetical protein
MSILKGLFKPIYDFQCIPFIGNNFYKFEPKNLQEKIKNKKKLEFDIDYYKNNKYVFFYYNNNNNNKIDKITSMTRFTYHISKVDVNDYNKYYYSNMDTKIEFGQHHYNLIEKVSYLQNKYNYESNIDYSLQLYKVDVNAKLDLFDCNTVRIANLSFYNTLNELKLENSRMFDNYSILLSEDNQKLITNLKNIIDNNMNNESLKVEYDKL